MSKTRLYDENGHITISGQEITEKYNKIVREFAKRITAKCAKDNLEYVDFKHYLDSQLNYVLVLEKLSYIGNRFDTNNKGKTKMPHPHKNRPRKGRRKIGSKKRKARRKAKA